MKSLKPKVSIIGCGNVGTRYVYALIIKGLARQIVMIDINKKRLEGDVMDLSHGAPYVPPVDIIVGDYPDIKDSDLIVISAGRGQRPKETRLDLIKDNIRLFREIIPRVVEVVPSAILLIATNPVDILSYAAYKISGKPSNEVIGSGTVLDSARFRYLLGRCCNIDPRNVHAYILGEHGDSEFPVWSIANIGGTLIKQYCPICENSKECNSENKLQNIFEEVRNIAYDIIDRKGETSYGIGLALARITQAILKDEQTILPVSTLIENYLGIEDIYLSLPAILNKSGIKKVLNIKLNAEEQESFIKSAQKMKEYIEKVDLI
jgi:L-lactate dehydrogenase